MKSSRLRGAALASLAFLASGTVQAQLPFPPASTTYPAVPTYPAPSAYPAPPAYPAPSSYQSPAPFRAAAYGHGATPAATPYGAAANPWSTRPVAFGAASMIPEPSVSVLGTAPAAGQVTGPTAASPTDISAPQGYGQASNFPAGSNGSVYGVPSGAPLATDPQASAGYSYATNGLLSTGLPGAGPAFTSASGGPVGAVPPAVTYPSAGTYPSTAGGYGGTYHGAHGYTGGGMGGTSAVCTGGSGYYDAACAPPAVGGAWYLGLYSLILSRTGQHHFTYSFDTGNEAIQYTDAKDTEIENEGGFAISVGRMFNCGCNAIEFVYWGWFPDDAAVYTYGANAIGNLNGIWNWDSLTYNGANAGVWVNDAQVHALFRSNEAHNLELNLVQIGNCGQRQCGSPWQYSLLAGVRYFRFQDRLIFASDTTDNLIDGDVTEISYDVKTVNNLIGFQVGGVGTYCLTPRFSLNGGTKFGLFGNNIEHESRIGGAAGTAVINNGPNNGVAWVVDNDKETVSFLGEIFLGATYCVGTRWSASAGYRAVAVTGMGLPTDQIYPDLRGINDAFTIESNGSLVLHGAYVGAQFCF